MDATHEEFFLKIADPSRCKSMLAVFRQKPVIFSQKKIWKTSNETPKSELAFHFLLPK